MFAARAYPVTVSLRSRSNWCCENKKACRNQFWCTYHFVWFEIANPEKNNSRQVKNILVEFLGNTIGSTKWGFFFAHRKPRYNSTMLCKVNSLDRGRHEHSSFVGFNEPSNRDVWQRRVLASYSWQLTKRHPAKSKPIAKPEKIIQDKSNINYSNACQPRSCHFPCWCLSSVCSPVRCSQGSRILLKILVHAVSVVEHISKVTFPWWNIYPRSCSAHARPWCCENK